MASKNVDRLHGLENCWFGARSLKLLLGTLTFEIVIGTLASVKIVAGTLAYEIDGWPHGL